MVQKCIFATLWIGTWYIVDSFCYYGITKLQINGIDYNIFKRKELTEK